MYEAQPTPGVTWMAPAAQFWAHAPHSMHPSRSTISAFFSFILNTAWGQTLSHTPQPTQCCPVKEIKKLDLNPLICYYGFAHNSQITKGDSGHGSF
jgi:hypothetical protein